MRKESRVEKRGGGSISGIPPHTTSIAELDLTDCPIGTVLDKTEPDQSVERRFFSEWRDFLTAPLRWGRSRNWRVTRDDVLEASALEIVHKAPACLLAGSPTMRDGAVEADVRQLLDGTLPGPDDEHARVARTGVVARVMGIRRFYFFCIEGNAGFRLYRRHDETWTLLGRIDTSIDSGRFYRLRLEMRGTRLRALVDGQVVAETHDPTRECGRFGIWGNTLARFASARIEEDAAAVRVNRSREKIFSGEERRRRDATPQAVVWREFPATGRLLGVVPRAKDGPALLFASTPFLKEERSKEAPTLSLTDLDGRELWRSSFPGGTLRRHVIGEARPGGCQLAALGESSFYLIDLKDGGLLAEKPLPPGGCFNGYRNGPNTVNGIEMFHPDGSGKPGAILLREDTAAGGNTFWVYDENLAPLWEETVDQPRLGHSADFADVDGDGRTEILIGHYLYGADGKRRWLMEDAQYLDRFQGARHADCPRFARLSDDPTAPLTAVFASGSDGIYFVDVADGRPWAHHFIGHAQRIRAGRFCPDLGGEQIWCANRWGNYGLMTLFGCGGEELFQFHPDSEGENFEPARWMRGTDLILLTRTEETLGLYDAAGFQVVDLRGHGPTYAGPVAGSSWQVADLEGNGRQFLLVQTGETFRILAPEE